MSPYPEIPSVYLENQTCYYYGALHRHQNEVDEYNQRHNSEDDMMVYDWEGKEATCFQMYIQENKSLEDIMEFFKVEHNFAPRYVIDCGRLRWPKGVLIKRIASTHMVVPNFRTAAEAHYIILTRTSNIMANLRRFQ